MKQDQFKGNEIRDEGAKALSEMLKVNQALTSLDLSSEEEGEKMKEKSQEMEKRTMNDR